MLVEDTISPVWFIVWIHPICHYNIYWNLSCGAVISLINYMDVLLISLFALTLMIP